VRILQKAQWWRVIFVSLIYRCRHLFFFISFFFWARLCCGPSKLVVSELNPSRQKDRDEQKVEKKKRQIKQQSFSKGMEDQDQGLKRRKRSFSVM
jgi:hypothetical protein